MNNSLHSLDSKKLILTRVVEKLNELAYVSRETFTGHSSNMHWTELGTGREGWHEKSDSDEDSHDFVSNKLSGNELYC